MRMQALSFSIQWCFSSGTSGGQASHTACCPITMLSGHVSFSLAPQIGTPSPCISHTQEAELTPTIQAKNSWPHSWPRLPAQCMHSRPGPHGQRQLPRWDSGLVRQGVGHYLVGGRWCEGRSSSCSRWSSWAVVAACRATMAVTSPVPKAGHVGEQQ